MLGSRMLPLSASVMRIRALSGGGFDRRNSASGSYYSLGGYSPHSFVYVKDFAWNVYDLVPSLCQSG